MEDDETSLLAELRSISVRSDPIRFLEELSLPEQTAGTKDVAKTTTLNLNEIKGEVSPPPTDIANGVGKLQEICHNQESSKSGPRYEATTNEQRDKTSDDQKLQTQLREISSQTHAFMRDKIGNHDIYPLDTDSVINDNGNKEGNKQDIQFPQTLEHVERMNIKTATKYSKYDKTFKGDRGGDANDDELLAELMAISNKNKGKDQIGRASCRERV